MEYFTGWGLGCHTPQRKCETAHDGFNDKAFRDTPEKSEFKLIHKYK